MKYFQKVAGMRIRRENLFLTTYVMVLTLLAVMGYVASDYTIRQQQARDAAARGSSPSFTTDVGFVALPRMNMTMTSSKGQATGRIRIDISLEVQQKDLARLEDYQPLITDRLISYVRKLDIEDIRRPNAVPNLRQDLLKQVNNASYPVPVLDIIFRQFVIM